jgi:hypothetical protein
MSKQLVFRKQLYERVRKKQSYERFFKRSSTTES